MKYIVGLDLGGNHVSCILMNKKGNIHKKINFKIKSKNKKEILNKIVESIVFVTSGIKEDILGIGIGVPGIIDRKKGTVSLVNLPELKDIKLKKIIEERFKLKVLIENDGNCAALAELIFGKGKGVNNLVCITLGTGFGTGIIINRKLYVGRGNAAEISHTVIESQGLKCSCGNNGCLEEYISTRGIQRIAKELGIHENDLAEIEKLANQGNIKAKKVFEISGVYLGIGLSNIVKTLDPDIIVISGGISNAGNLIMGPAIREMKKRTFFNTPPVVISNLKDNIVNIGAASQFLNLL